MDWSSTLEATSSNERLLRRHGDSWNYDWHRDISEAREAQNCSSGVRQYNPHPLLMTLTNSPSSVCTKPGDRVPGPRSHALLAPVEFPWKEAADSIQEVGAKDSYRLSMILSREGLICGPSSGFNLQGMPNASSRWTKRGTNCECATPSGTFKMGNN